MCWLHRMQRKHSFKIIQSEQLFLSKDSFQSHLRYLRCYVHSVDVDDDEYNEWMKQFVTIDNKMNNMQFVQYNINGMTKRGNTLDPILRNMIDESYKVSNKWLKLLIDDLLPDIVLNGKWDWNLWN